MIQVEAAQNALRQFIIAPRLHSETDTEDKVLEVPEDRLQTTPRHVAKSMNIYIHIQVTSGRATSIEHARLSDKSGLAVVALREGRDGDVVNVPDLRQDFEAAKFFSFLERFLGRDTTPPLEELEGRFPLA